MRKKRKELKTKQIIFIIIIIVIFLLIIFSITLKKDRKLNKIESLIKDSVIGVEKIKICVNHVSVYHHKLVALLLILSGCIAVFHHVTI
jgi:hypothetical protein